MPRGARSEAAEPTGPESSFAPPPPRAPPSRPTGSQVSIVAAVLFVSWGLLPRAAATPSPDDPGPSLTPAELAECDAALSAYRSREIWRVPLNGRFDVETPETSPNDSPLAFFLHVPRTSGRNTSQCLLRSAVPLARHCANSYDALRLRPAHRRDEAASPDASASTPTCDFAQSHDDLSGLVDALAEAGGREVSLLTVLRDPLTRVVSAYDMAVRLAVGAVSSQRRASSIADASALRGDAADAGREHEETEAGGGVGLGGPLRLADLVDRLRRPSGVVVRGGQYSSNTTDIWPWSLLVPWTREEIGARFLEDPEAVSGRPAAEYIAWRAGRSSSPFIGALISDAVPSDRLSPRTEAATALAARGTLDWDPDAAPEVWPTLDEFLRSDLADEVLHNNQTFQLLGLTTQSTFPEAATLRRCARESIPHGDALLADALQLLGGAAGVGVFERRAETIAALALALNAKLDRRQSADLDVTLGQRFEVCALGAGVTQQEADEHSFPSFFGAVPVALALGGAPAAASSFDPSLFRGPSKEARRALHGDPSSKDDENHGLRDALALRNRLDLRLHAEANRLLDAAMSRVNALAAREGRESRLLPDMTDEEALQVVAALEDALDHRRSSTKEAILDGEESSPAAVVGSE